MKTRAEFFWPGLADLMTALFAVMLVLFVLSFKLFKDKELRLESYATNYARILKNWKKPYKVLITVNILIIRRITSDMSCRYLFSLTSGRAPLSQNTAKN